MKRNLPALAAKEFDVVIIGGGVFGACAAWDAAQRGLAVALVDRGDFGACTSANSFKFIHGGIRYLQHGDLHRIRQSSNERRCLLRIAPHLVHPIPVAIPTYGHGRRGKSALRAGLALYDLLTFDRNRGIRDAARRIPGSFCISRQDALERFPMLDHPSLTGAGIYSEGQLYNPPRLVLAFVQSATKAGAVTANHVRATGFIEKSGRIVGVTVHDCLKHEDFAVRAKIVLNAAGPYAEKLLKESLGLELHPIGRYSRDACFIVARDLLGSNCGVAVQGRTRDPDAVLSRGRRHLFLVPWDKFTLVGVWHSVHDGNPEELKVSALELQSFLDEVNGACSGLRLGLDDVSMWNAGLVPFGENTRGATDLRYAHRSRLVDHQKDHGLAGLVTLIGLRFTTGRYEASRAIDLVFRKLGRNPPRCRTASTPLYGGRIADFDRFLREAISGRPEGVTAAAMVNIARNCGTKYPEVLGYMKRRANLRRFLGTADILAAQALYAVREEAAETLGDVVFQRTGLAAARRPDMSDIQACANAMAQELDWGRERLGKEVAAVEKILRRHSGAVSPPRTIPPRPAAETSPVQPTRLS